MSRRIETIEIGSGVEYAKVVTRLQEFLADNAGKAVQIATDCQFKEGWALFKATVECSRGIFTGHSMGKVGGKKALEKQETIAVGRALAFAGYLASGEIATFEEMEDRLIMDGMQVEAMSPAMQHAHKTLRDCKTTDDVRQWQDRVHHATQKGTDDPLFTEDQLSELDRMAEMHLSAWARMPVF